MTTTETTVTSAFRPTKADDLLPAGAPRLGLGCGDLYSGEHEAHSHRLVRTAFDAGVRYFDVARLYGNGQAEGVVGRALRDVRDQVIITSKAGIVPWSMQTGTRLRRKALTTAARLAPFAKALLPAAPPAVERHGVFAPAEILRSVETSLRALQTDYLDVLLLHECGLPDATNGETLSLLERLRTEGKVRTYGIATRGPETQAILSAEPRYAVAQFPSDAFNRNEQNLPQGWDGLVITHSIYKRGLGRLRDALQADRRRAEAWERDLAVAANDAALAKLLLQDALSSHDGLVLFTTSRPERIADAVEAARTVDPALIARFRNLLPTTPELAEA